jgi:hypothetical protein
MRHQGSTPFPPGSVRRRAAVGVAGLAALAATACGRGGGSTSPTSAPAATVSIVRPPDFTLQGCTYVLDSTIPASEPQGLKPGFPPFSADGSATTALRHIKDHGGTAMVDSVTLPSGTRLYAGPDLGGASVGAIPAQDSILAAEPVVWTGAHGDTWLAFYLSCGGDALYWVSVKGLEGQNPSAGGAVAAQIAQLRQASLYTKTGTASLLPIVVNGRQQLAFSDPKVTFPVGRGELVGLPD